MSDYLFTSQTTRSLIYSALSVLVWLQIKWLLSSPPAAYSPVYIFYIFLNYFYRSPALWACTWQTAVCLCKLDCSREVCFDQRAQCCWHQLLLVELQEHLFTSPSTNPSAGKFAAAEWIRSSSPARMTPQNLNMVCSRLRVGNMLGFESRIFLPL